MSNLIPLLPCPFCGGSPDYVLRDVEPQGDSWYGERKEMFILCDCGACLFDGSFHEGFGNSIEEYSMTAAAALWNKRAADRENAGD